MLMASNTSCAPTLASKSSPNSSPVLFNSNASLLMLNSFANVGGDDSNDYLLKSRILNTANSNSLSSSSSTASSSSTDCGSANSGLGVYNANGLMNAANKKLLNNTKKSNNQSKFHLNFQQRHKNQFEQDDDDDDLFPSDAANLFNLKSEHLMNDVDTDQDDLDLEYEENQEMNDDQENYLNEFGEKQAIHANQHLLNENEFGFHHHQQADNYNNLNANECVDDNDDELFFPEQKVQLQNNLLNSKQQLHNLNKLKLTNNKLGVTGNLTNRKPLNHFNHHNQQLEQFIAPHILLSDDENDDEQNINQQHHNHHRLVHNPILLNRNHKSCKFAQNQVLNVTNAVHNDNDDEESAGLNSIVTRHCSSSSHDGENLLNEDFINPNLLTNTVDEHIRLPIIDSDYDFNVYHQIASNNVNTLTNIVNNLLNNSNNQNSHGANGVLLNLNDSVNNETNQLNLSDTSFNSLTANELPPTIDQILQTQKANTSSNLANTVNNATKTNHANNKKNRSIESGTNGNDHETSSSKSNYKSVNKCKRVRLNNNNTNTQIENKSNNLATPMRYQTKSQKSCTSNGIKFSYSIQI